ncbi:hypothetical protein L2E82_33352 [Cichorium intybus]|uniref:Uncharacterized protein n=1 Tax=Cichorium intybus TaxID=13427 RepID=A0ACB9BKA3_CICIN|nr:hypothetical protein L2E82_53700 [Cichorium intybus]KAI3671176.1 hypothetical protein L2E82_53559 [Cichorium intybus]KAI3722319.1 hypothetical protein L2E82_33352 [Cichorium intybus]
MPDLSSTRAGLLSRQTSQTDRPSSCPLAFFWLTKLASETIAIRESATRTTKQRDYLSPTKGAKLGWASSCLNSKPHSPSCYGTPSIARTRLKLPYARAKKSLYLGLRQQVMIPLLKNSSSKTKRSGLSYGANNRG